MMRGHDALFEVCDAGLEFALLDEPLGVVVDQPSDPLAQLADPRLSGRQIGPIRLPSRIVQTPLVLLNQPLRVLQQATPARSHRQVHQIGADLRVVAEALPAEAVRIAAERYPHGLPHECNPVGLYPLLRS